MRVFLDANILFSASLPQSLLLGFLRALGRHADLLVNSYAQEEAKRNLIAKYPECVESFQKLAAELESVPDQLFEMEVPLADKDLPILCGAILGKADFLLTGDKKDFGHLFGRKVQGVQVVTVEMLMVELVKQGVIRLEKGDEDEVEGLG